VEFSVSTEGGMLVGWEAGGGDPALIFHGGPTSDNTDIPLARATRGVPSGGRENPLSV